MPFYPTYEEWKGWRGMETRLLQSFDAVCSRFKRILMNWKWGRNGNE